MIKVYDNSIFNLLSLWILSNNSFLRRLYTNLTKPKYHQDIVILDSYFELSFLL